MTSANESAKADQAPHHWLRYVALGDSFTEGIGDPEPTSLGGHRGWADRTAEVLAQGQPDFAYANLAIRGRLLQQILDEQVAPALRLKPDLITISAGGNDLIRPGSDPDDLAARFEAGVKELNTSGATLVLFTGVDVSFSPVFKAIRGKVAIYNESIRLIADKYNCLIADMWALQELHDTRMWDEDRLHLSPLGHHTVARMLLDTLGVEHKLEALNPGPIPERSWSQARVEDLLWAKEYLVPWVIRRLKKESSGDGIEPKRPQAVPVNDPLSKTTAGLDQDKIDSIAEANDSAGVTDNSVSGPADNAANSNAENFESSETTDEATNLETSSKPESQTSEQSKEQK